MKRSTPYISYSPCLDILVDIWPIILSFLSVTNGEYDSGYSFEYLFVLKFVSKTIRDIVLKYQSDYSEKFICDPMLYLVQYMENRDLNLIWWLRDINVLPPAINWMDYDTDELWESAGALGDISVLKWLEKIIQRQTIDVLDGAAKNDHVNVFDFIFFTLDEDVWGYDNMEYWLDILCQKGHVNVLKRLVGGIYWRKNKNEWYIITIIPNNTVAKTAFNPWVHIIQAIENNHPEVLEIFKNHGAFLDCLIPNQIAYIRKYMEGPIDEKPKLEKKTIMWLEDSLGSN